MPTPEEAIDPQHQQTRGLLRILGPLILCFGLFMLAFGTYQMFSPGWTSKADPGEGFMEGRKSIEEVSRESRTQFNDDARTSFGGFAMAAIGLVSCAAGLAMTAMGFAGRVARYQAAELTPVASSTINSLGTNASQGIHDVAESIANGIRDAQPQNRNQRICPNCQNANPSAARFCNRCGQTLT